MDNKIKITQLIELVQKLPENCIDEAFNSINKIIEDNTPKSSPPPCPCPHCKSEHVVRFGTKRGKQRYRCLDCRKTFVETTNTIMYYSRRGKTVWEQVVKDTLDGVSIDKTAESLELSHWTVFHMRHKILMAMENDETDTPTQLDGISELDDTYVLESMKGTKIPDDYWRGPRKHGATAQKPGISNEYVSICTGVERDGEAYAKTVNRATPSKENISEAFGQHVNEKTFVLCDGAKSYGILSKENKCEVVSIKTEEAGDCLANLNTVNSFHSFIKERYRKYRGVATKYLNRYNALFSKSFRLSNDARGNLVKTVMRSGERLYNNVLSVRGVNLLLI